MATSTLQIRVDGGLRRDAETFFANAGLDMSSAVRLFLRQVVIRQRLPFEIVAENPDPFFSEANQRVLAESIRSLEQGKGQVHELLKSQGDPSCRSPSRPARGTSTLVGNSKTRRR